MLKEIIENNDFKLLIERAEELGNGLGIAGMSTATNMYRVIINIEQKYKSDKTYNYLHLLRPKLATLVAKSYFREKSLIEKFYIDISDTIYLITDVTQRCSAP